MYTDLFERYYAVSSFMGGMPSLYVTCLINVWHNAFMRGVLGGGYD